MYERGVLPELKFLLSDKIMCWVGLELYKAKHRCSQCLQESLYDYHLLEQLIAKVC